MLSKIFDLAFDQKKRNISMIDDKKKKKILHTSLIGGKLEGVKNLRV